MHVKESVRATDMKLDIVVCYSTLEFCFFDVHYYERQNKGRLILDEIRRKRVNMNDDLLVYYETYFEDQGQDLFEEYQMWFSNQVLYSEHVKFVQNNLSAHAADSISDEYLKILVNIAYLNEDKIIFSELLENNYDNLKRIGILQMNIDRILNTNEDNYYNSYRFPIIRKRIAYGDSSADLSNWLRRIIQKETEFEIIDGYILQEINNFKTYFLPHVQANATIKIYTILDRISGSDLTDEFFHPFYSRWNIEIYLIQSKRYQHARNILTDNYFIQLEKGMRIFGENGLTDQSDITVDYKIKMHDNSMPPVYSRLI